MNRKSYAAVGSSLVLLAAGAVFVAPASEQAAVKNQVMTLDQHAAKLSEVLNDPSGVRTVTEEMLRTVVEERMAREVFRSPEGRKVRADLMRDPRMAAIVREVAAAAADPRRVTEEKKAALKNPTVMRGVIERALLAEAIERPAAPAERP